MSALAVGIDIGGTKIAAGLVDRSGTVVARLDAPTPASAGGAQVVATAAALALRLTAGHDVQAVGVGSAGVIDPVHRRVIAATDSVVGWAGTELGELLEQALGMPVVTDNDGHAHGVGEAFAGAGRGYGTVLVAGVGTGIGGAVVVNGIPQTGAHWAAGHVGHIPVAAAAGLPCPCGKSGHLEAVASGTGLWQLYLRKGGRPEARDARAVVARAETDPLAHDAVVESATALGEGLGGLVNVIDPDVVVIAGGMRNAGALWWSALEAGLRQTVLPLLQEVLLVRARLGDDAAIIGAAKRAFDATEKPHD